MTSRRDRRALSGVLHVRTTRPGPEGVASSRPPAGYRLDASGMRAPRASMQRSTSARVHDVPIRPTRQTLPASTPRPVAELETALHQRGRLHAHTIGDLVRRQPLVGTGT